MGVTTSQRLVKSIQDDTDLRLIVPFGLNLRLGDVIGVGKDGTFTLEGSTRSLLGMAPGQARKPTAAGDLYLLTKEGSTCDFRAKGRASTLFPELPSASAGIDVHFGSAEGWVLGVTGRQLYSLDETNRFREPIIRAYQNGKTWKKDWALVTGLAMADRVTLLAAKTANTNVALSISGAANAGAGMEVHLTSKVSIQRTSKEITQWLQPHRAPMACSAIRVSDSWFSDWWGPSVKPLNFYEALPTDALGVPELEFWDKTVGTFHQPEGE